jgi:hypothetical protein
MAERVVLPQPFWFSKTPRIGDVQTSVTMGELHLGDKEPAGRGGNVTQGHRSQRLRGHRYDSRLLYGKSFNSQALDKDRRVEGRDTP